MHPIRNFGNLIVSTMRLKTENSTNKDVERSLRIHAWTLFIQTILNVWLWGGIWYCTMPSSYLAPILGSLTLGGATFWLNRHIMKIDVMIGKGKEVLLLPAVITLMLGLMFCNMVPVYIFRDVIINFLGYEAGFIELFNALKEMSNQDQLLNWVRWGLSITIVIIEICPTVLKLTSTKELDWHYYRY